MSLSRGKNSSQELNSSCPLSSGASLSQISVSQCTGFSHFGIQNLKVWTSSRSLEYLIQRIRWRRSACYKIESIWGAHTGGSSSVSDSEIWGEGDQYPIAGPTRLLRAGEQAYNPIRALFTAESIILKLTRAQKGIKSNWMFQEGWRLAHWNSLQSVQLGLFLLKTHYHFCMWDEFT